MNDVSGFLPRPERRLITTRREYLDGADLVLALARREIVVFDPDLALLEINDAARIARLASFLAAGQDNRIAIAVHDPDPIRIRYPRLVSLLAQHPDKVAIHRTEDDAARAQDCFVLADAEHFVRRAVAAQGRGSIVLHDQKEGRPMRDRFGEIWQSSVLAISGTTLGL
jgi:hypothetical protein